MIEVPSAAIAVRSIAQEVDFLSIGTNDLVQYLLAADRVGQEANSGYESFHPAVIKRSNQSLTRPERAKTWLFAGRWPVTRSARNSCSGWE
jgi:phosphotransferase system enzyme I (PtsI)